MSSACSKDAVGAWLLQTAEVELATWSVNSSTLLLCVHASCCGSLNTYMNEQPPLHRGKHVVEALGGLRCQSPVDLLA